MNKNDNHDTGAQCGAHISQSVVKIEYIRREGLNGPKRYLKACQKKSHKDQEVRVVMGIRFMMEG